MLISVVMFNAPNKSKYTDLVLETVKCVLTSEEFKKHFTDLICKGKTVEEAKNIVWITFAKGKIKKILKRYLIGRLEGNPSMWILDDKLCYNGEYEKDEMEIPSKYLNPERWISNLQDLLNDACTSIMSNI